MAMRSLAQRKKDLAARRAASGTPMSASTQRWVNSPSRDVASGQAGDANSMNVGFTARTATGQPSAQGPTTINPQQNPIDAGPPPAAPVDYDALIANDPEYQLLLRKLEAAMANAHADAGAESANIKAQTLRRLQQLKEQGSETLTRTDEDFSGRGLGFSGGRLEAQDRVRRQITEGQTQYMSDEAQRLADIQRQLAQTESETRFGREQGLLATAEKVRGRAGSLGAIGVPTGDLQARGQTEASAPEVISPGAVQRRATGVTGAGGVLDNHRKKRQGLNRKPGW